MTKENSSSLRISSQHFRRADLVLAIVFTLTALVSVYYAVTENSREFWALLLVGVFGAYLSLKRYRAS